MAVPGAVPNDVELLFQSLVQGSPEECRGMLESFEDIDVRNGNGQTLLHVAVKLGRLEWVKMLLAMGSNPYTLNKNGLSVLEVAEGTCSTYPDREHCRTIVRLMRSVCRVDNVSSRDKPSFEMVHKARKMESSTVDPFPGRGGGSLPRVVTRAGSSAFLRDYARFRGGSRRPGSQDRESGWGVREGIVECHPNTSSSAASWILGVEVGAVDRTSQELSALRSVCDTSARQMLRMSEAMKDMKSEVVQMRSQLALRDLLIEKLETTLTSMAEEWKPLRESLSKTQSKVEDVGDEVKTLKKSCSVNLLKTSIGLTEELNVHFKCIESMMRKTFVVEEDGDKMTKARKLYDKLYSTNPFASLPMIFLQFREEVRIMLDWDCSDISRMIEKFTDLNGDVQDGGYTNAFADLDNLTIYVALSDTEGQDLRNLAYSLSQMAVLLVFKNGGLPYAEDDRDQGRLYKKIVKDAKMKKRGGECLDEEIRGALEMKNGLAREVFLFSVVPSMVSLRGLTEGTSLLHQQLPQLFHFYVDHIHHTMALETQGVMGTQKCCTRKKL